MEQCVLADIHNSATLPIRQKLKTTMFQKQVTALWGQVTEWVSSVLRPLQHSIGYTGDGFYRSKKTTNSIKVLKEDLQKTKKTTKYRYT